MEMDELQPTSPKSMFVLADSEFTWPKSLSCLNIFPEVVQWSRLIILLFTN
jgi:hypothetical protein